MLKIATFQVTLLQDRVMNWITPQVVRFGHTTSSYFNHLFDCVICPLIFQLLQLFAA